MTTSRLGIASPRRIVVFRALFLGDLLCAVPALNALDARFPDTEITMVGLPWAREIAERLSVIDRFVEFPGYAGLPELPADPARPSAFLERMRAERHDVAIQLHGSGGVTNDLVAAFGAATTLGYGSDSDRRLSLVLPWREDEHEISRWLRLVAALGADGTDTSIEMPVSDAEHRDADRLLDALHVGTGPTVGLHAGAKDEARRWPAHRFAELGDELASRHGARIVLTGSAGERHLGDEIVGRMAAPALDLVGGTDLGTFLGVVGRLDLLVTNDTGASHIAAATRTRSVVLFGPTRPARWAPLDRSLHAVIDARNHVAEHMPPDNSLRHLHVARVLVECDRMLGQAAVVAGAPGIRVDFAHSSLEHP